jgi:hypothetical protein
MRIARTAKLSTILAGLALFASLGAVPPAMGEEPAALEPTPEAKQAAYQKKAVCKKVPVVGTRISKTYCQTAAQRDADAKTSQEFLKNVQGNSAYQTQSKN